MRRRVLATTKVLAVAALAAVPACTKPEPSPITADNAGAGVASAVPITTDARAEDPKLVALRDELDAMKRGDALAKVEHFRPLCDEAGFPLVGNLARKAPEDSPTK